MELKYQSYPFSRILGWSISRYETFDKCKRQYYYSYYSKFVTGIQAYKFTQLRELTSIPLEIGNVVHDVLEAFLRRLQKSDTDINEERFFHYARSLFEKYFTEKSFIETYYGYLPEIDKEKAFSKVEKCLNNFIGSACYNWIFMVAMINRSNWMIEPAGFGETRLNGLKAYCKMDFLLPVHDDIYILDWKTGAKDPSKHSSQLMGYAAATNSNFTIPWNRIFPKIVYLYPSFDELEINVETGSLDDFYNTIRLQTEQMYSYCKDVQENIPLPIESFEMNPSPSTCRQCRFQELCFSGRCSMVKKEDMDFQ
ncbi:MAG: PD-(D/E)XK nuclease family protein [Fibrobacter sp.]|nr:PD-(D/E)XK nuclease family protein [Fibrobacter sp.]